MRFVIEDALKFAEARGFSVSVHPTETTIVRGYREYLLINQLEDQVSWSVREPMLSGRRDGFAQTSQELMDVIGGLR